ncbi:hypothetical protein [Nostoc sp.]
MIICWLEKLPTNKQKSPIPDSHSIPYSQLPTSNYDLANEYSGGGVKP